MPRLARKSDLARAFHQQQRDVPPATRQTSAIRAKTCTPFRGSGLTKVTKPVILPLGGIASQFRLKPGLQTLILPGSTTSGKTWQIQSYRPQGNTAAANCVGTITRSVGGEERAVAIEKLCSSKEQRDAQGSNASVQLP